MDETLRGTAVVDERQLDMIGISDGEDLLNHIGDEQALEHAWPATLAEMVDVIAHHMERQRKSDRTTAQTVAREITVLLARHFGGHPIYIPKGNSLDLAIRDTKIWHEFNGRNVTELARRYKLTDMRVYSIIKVQRRLHVDRIQCQLPLD